MANNIKETFKLDGEEYFYIHRDSKNFKNDNATLELFKEQRDSFYTEMLSRYKQNFLNSIFIDKKTLEVLNQTMSEDTIINSIDNDVLNALNDILKNKNNFNLEDAILKSYSSIDVILKNKGNKMAEINKILAAISEASETLEDENAIKMLSVLSTTNFKTTGQLQNVLNKLLARYEKNIINIDWEKAINVLKRLQNLVNAIQTDPNLDDKRDQKARKALVDIFSTEFGEYVVAKAVKGGLAKFGKEFETALTGSDTLKLTDKGALKLWESYGSQSKVFKADASFSNVNLEIQDGKNITINLGLSVKWYKTLIGANTGTVTFMSEESATYRLKQFLDKTKTYYVYNIIAHKEDYKDEYTSFMETILTRNFDTMLSGMGVEGDFSQFIVINGKPFSIWSIMNALSKDFDSKRGAIAHLSIDKVNEIGELNKKAFEEKKNDMYKAYVRSRKQNQMLDKANLHGSLNFSKLSTLVK